MKISHMLAAAGLALASIGVSTAADARPHDRDGWRYDRGDHRGWDRRGGYAYGYGRGYGYGDGHGHGYGRQHYRGGPRCWTEWRRHHRVRVCR